MDKPVNSIDFTIDVLVNLRNFLDDHMVEKLDYFCDYDKQALLDAVIYLKWLRG